MIQNIGAEEGTPCTAQLALKLMECWEAGRETGMHSCPHPVGDTMPISVENKTRGPQHMHLLIFMTAT